MMELVNILLFIAKCGLPPGLFFQLGCTRMPQGIDPSD